MSAGRVLLLLIVVGVIAWLVKSQHILGPSPPDGGSTAPIDRARTAARRSDAQTAEAEAASRELNSQPPSGGGISENMTAEQVRALVGPPDAVDSETTDTGVTRERWTYRNVSKTVVFENGIVVRVE